MEYLTAEDYAAAIKNGISRKNAYQRFYVYGWTKERTINEPLRDRSFFKKYKEKCAEIGLNYQTFLKRLRRGISPEDALYLPKKPKLSPDLIAIAEKNGISPSTAKIRAYQYKWSVDRAITEPVHTEFRRKTKAQ